MTKNQFTKTKTFTLSSFNILNFTEWNNSKGQDKQGVVLKVGSIQDKGLLSMTYSPKMVSTFKVENGKLIRTEDKNFNIIKVKFVDDAERIYKLSYLENGEFLENEFTQDELFALLKEEQEKTMDYIKSTDPNFLGE